MSKCCQKLILGIGNRLRSDDAAGSIIAEKCKSMGLPSIDAEYMPQNYIAIVRRYNPQKIVIIDTCDMALSSGEFRRIPINKISNEVITTHSMPMVDILHKLQEITPEITFIGIQPHNIDVGDTVSIPVQEAIEKVIDCIIQGLEESIPLV
ncbi:MAG: hydrogenase maturation protease [Spirochaetes bacterium]|nr:hydrogenase maturation protease [Spirochaetota bacterium]